MKKFLLSCALVLGVLMFGGCSVSNEAYIKNNLSETVENYFEAKGENYSAYIYQGDREKEYRLDGKKGGELEKYTLLKVVLKSGATYNSISLSITIGETENEIKAEYLESDGNFYADLTLDITKDSQMTINYSGESLALVCKSNDFEVTIDEAIKIASSELSDNIKTSKDANRSCEFQVRVLSSSGIDNLYYGVMMYDEKSNFVGVVIDAHTGKVITKS